MSHNGWQYLELDPALKERVRPVLARLIEMGALKIWLFGSQALGWKPGSDVDLLVVGPPDLRVNLGAKRRPIGWRGKFDVLVNIEGEDEFSEPWRRADNPMAPKKRGSFKAWRWRETATGTSYMRSNSLRPNAPPDFPQPAILLYDRTDRSFE
jgi:predicted nucleotidyltransferase